MAKVDESRAAGASMNLKMAEGIASLRKPIADLLPMLDRNPDGELLKILRDASGKPSLFDSMQEMLKQLLMTAAVYDDVIKGIQARAANLLARAQAAQQPPRGPLN